MGQSGGLGMFHCCPSAGSYARDVLEGQLEQPPWGSNTGDAHSTGDNQRRQD